MALCVAFCGSPGPPSTPGVPRNRAFHIPEVEGLEPSTADGAPPPRVPHNHVTLVRGGARRPFLGDPTLRDLLLV